jgi:hypothetical protein
MADQLEPSTVSAPSTSVAAESKEDTRQAEKTTRYSSRYEGLQKAERRLTRASHQLGEAVLAGIESWDRSREKSARSKKDGAVKDGLENFTKAYAKTIREAAGVPRQVVKGVAQLYPKKARKLLGL